MNKEYKQTSRIIFPHFSALISRMYKRALLPFCIVIFVPTSSPYFLLDSYSFLKIHPGPHPVPLWDMQVGGTHSAFLQHILFSFSQLLGDMIFSERKAVFHLYSQQFAQCLSHSRYLTNIIFPLRLEIIAFLIKSYISDDYFDDVNFMFPRQPFLENLLCVSHYMGTFHSQFLQQQWCQRNGNSDVMLSILQF